MLPSLALAWLLGAAQVPAPPDPAAVQWTAPPECPDRAAVEAAIARRLGRPLAAAEAQVEARVVRDPEREYTLHLRLTAGARTETRAVRDRSCAALADLAALLVVAAVEPPGPAPAASPAPELAPEVVPEVVPAPASPPVVTRPEVPLEIAPVPAPKTMPKGAGWFVRLHGGGELGAVPRPTGAVGLAGGALWRRWRLEVQGLVLAPQTATVVALGEARVGLFAGAVHGCGRLGRGPVEVPLCLGLEAGAMRGEGRRVTGGRTAVSGWLAAVIGPSLAWHAGRRWSVWAGLQLVFAPVRPVFQLSDRAREETLYRPSVVSGRLVLGVEVRIADRW